MISGKVVCIDLPKKAEGSPSLALDAFVSPDKTAGNNTHEELKQMFTVSYTFPLNWVTLARWMRTISPMR